MKKISLLLTLFFAINMHVQSQDGFLQAKATIAGIHVGKISKTELLKAEEVKIDSANLKITAYRVTLIRKDQDLKELSHHGNGEIEKTIKEQMATCNVGDKIFIEYIRCADVNKKSFTLKPISLVVSE
jgi:hypothetical protein